MSDQATAAEWQAIEYALDPGGPDDHESGLWGITVAWRGDDSWGVYRGCHAHPLHFGFDRHGDLNMEPSHDERTDEWKADHRFTLDEALALGERMLPLVVVNGMTWAMVERWRDAGHPRDDAGRPLIPAIGGAA